MVFYFHVLTFLYNTHAHLISWKYYRCEDEYFLNAIKGGISKRDRGYRGKCKEGEKNIQSLKMSLKTSTFIIPYKRFPLHPSVYSSSSLSFIIWLCRYPSSSSPPIDDDTSLAVFYTKRLKHNFSLKLSFFDTSTRIFSAGLLPWPWLY